MPRPFFLSTQACLLTGALSVGLDTAQPFQPRRPPKIPRLSLSHSLWCNQ